MDEILRILKLVERGDLTAEQGARRLSAMGCHTQATSAARGAYGRRMLRILVNGGPGDKVQIQLPVGAVRQILKATGKLPIPDQDLQGVDLPQLTAAVSSCLAAETEGDLVHVASPDGTQVRIFVEPDHQTR